jgi:glycosyltransferase involved in cell wall biosynthesis
MLGAEWMTTRTGGLNRYFDSLARALTLADRLTVSAFAFGEAPARANMHSLGTLEESLLRRSARIHHLAGVARRRHAIVDTHFAPYSPFLRRHDRGIAPSVVHFHGPWSAEGARSGEHWARTRVKRGIERRVYGSATHLVVLSESFRDLLVGDFEVPAEKVTVVPGGVDTSTFTPNPALPRRPRSVLSVRRLERRMGLDVLIDAWPKVVSTAPGSMLRIAGDGPERTRLTQRAAARGVADSVVFLGHVPEANLVAEYQQATVSVVPSVDLEGFGLVVLESLACGTPVIASRVGGLPTVLGRLDQAALVRPRDPDSLAAALVRSLGGMRPPAETCAQLARRYSWDSVARSHLDLYQTL